MADRTNEDAAHAVRLDNWIAWEAEAEDANLITFSFPFHFLLCCWG